jgi:hypothetical protein
MSLRIPYYNMTIEDINATVDEMSIIDIYKIFIYGFAAIVIVSVAIICYTNVKLTPNLNNWIMNNFKAITKKAKESPYITYTSAPLPECPILDGTEKGQNAGVKRRVYRHLFTVNETNQETNITITVQDS